MQFLRLSLVGNLSGPDFFYYKNDWEKCNFEKTNLLLEKLKKQ